MEELVNKSKDTGEKKMEKCDCKCECCKNCDKCKK